MALLSRTEGIIPAIESAHAVAGALRLAEEGRDRAEATILVNLSGRGDKDMGTAVEWFGLGDPTRPRRRGGMSVAVAPSRRPGRGPRRAGRLPARRLPRRRRRHRGHDRRWSRPAATSSRSACPTATRSWTARPSRPPPSRRSTGGVRTTDVLRTVEAVAATGAPTVIMTYWNPVERYGVERFAADLAAAGGAGLITPDLIPDEARSGSPPPTRTTSTRSSWSRRPRPTRGSR